MYEYLIKINRIDRCATLKTVYEKNLDTKPRAYHAEMQNQRHNMYNQQPKWKLKKKCLKFWSKYNRS